MFGFGKKKKADPTPAPIQEPEYTCLFCKKRFKASEIVFAHTLSRPDPRYNDVIFDQAIKKYQAMSARDEAGRIHGLQSVGRRILDKNRWKVLKYEDAEHHLPKMVSGPFVKTENDVKAADDDLGFAEGNISAEMANETLDEMEVISAERLCPYCHFTLPEGFATSKVIQVGLLGGSRSGKTTYMAVVTEYLRNKMGSLNSGLDLASVELLPECAKYQEALYLSQRDTDGASATPIIDDVQDQMIMPIVLRITPTDKTYSPFFLVFQDIPGEYLKPENERLLLNSNIRKSNELILLVDINHFIHTVQQDDNAEFGGYCRQDVNELFANIGSLSELIPEGQLTSVQCTLTKLDFWIEEEKSRLEGARFITNCDSDHKAGIDRERLSIIHEQIEGLLANIGGQDQSGLLQNLINSLNLTGSNLHYGYTAVASRIVPGHEDNLRDAGADYRTSLNVLEPLMNIFDWEHLLPVKATQTE